MQIILIDLINFIAPINILINLAPDSMAPMQISLLPDSLAPAAILNIFIYELLQN